MRRLLQSFPDALMEGHSYALYYYVDVNSNNTCDGPALDMDHAWAVPIAEVTGDVDLVGLHNFNLDGDRSKHREAGSPA